MIMNWIYQRPEIGTHKLDMYPGKYTIKVLCHTDDFEYECDEYKDLTYETAVRFLRLCMKFGAESIVQKGLTVRVIL